jgi:hypothetical protein
MPRILVATREGLHRFDEKGVPESVDHAGRHVSSVARERSALWAVVDGTEIWHAPDAIAAGLWAWERVVDLDGGLARLRATVIADTDAGVLVGTSEARLLRNPSGGGLEVIAGFDEVDGRSTWYTPWGGPPDTRSMADWDDDVYVNVHVGGILRTDDRGERFTPTIDVDADVHQVATAEGLVLAACAGGLATSTDRGSTWDLRSDGLEARYSRAVTVCGDAVLVSASNGPRGGRAAVYRGAIATGAFERCRTGLPEWFDDNIDSYCLDSLPDGSLAAFGTSDGQVFATTDGGATWDEIASGLPPVGRVLVMP